MHGMLLCHFITVRTLHIWLTAIMSDLDDLVDLDVEHQTANLIPIPQDLGEEGHWFRQW